LNEKGFDAVQIERRSGMICERILMANLPSMLLRGLGHKRLAAVKEKGTLTSENSKASGVFDRDGATIKDSRPL